MTSQLFLRVAMGLAFSLGAAGCAASDVGLELGDDGQNDDGQGDDGAPGDEVRDDAGADGKLDSGVVGKNDAGAAVKNDAGASDELDGSAGGKRDSGSVSIPDASSGGDDGGVSTSDAAVLPGDPYAHADGKYVNLAVPLGTPLDRSKGDSHPMAGYTPPAGWTWYNIEGAVCRDGSQNGIMVHYAAAASDKLFIYFEGGGACANPGFCTLNPVNVNQQFLTGGESALASLVILNAPQAPTNAGIFDLANAANPYKDWNMVYIPYCTGDVHFGAAPKGTIEGVPGTQAFAGAENTRRVIARVAATFTNTTRFIAGGSSAGGYGAGLNFGMIQDTFGVDKALGSALLDASPPFSNTYAPVCLQKRWRESWNLDANLPSDCGEQCKSADGGNLFNIVDYWRAKYPRANIALISGIHDEIIRLFFSLGNDNCSNYGADPTALFVGTVGQTYDPAKFLAGLTDLRTRYQDTHQLATYYMDGFPNSTAHQCLFRPRVYEEAAGVGKGTIASFLSKFTGGEMTQVGP